MPEKRMFTKKITESDAFLDMPLSSQCLYFHLNMSADDDGFVNNPKRVMRTIGASEDDLKLLIAKAFLLVFENGVVVIKHWWMHNTLKNDRYKPTDYQEEKELLAQKTNKAYTWKQNGNILETQPNQDKHNQDKPNNKYSVLDGKSNDFTEAFLNYADMRKRIKKPLTEDLAKKVVQKLNKLSGDEKEQIEILDQSTFNYWQGVFPLHHTTARKTEDTLPVYSTAKNKELTKEQEEELLLLMKGNQ